MTSPENKKLSFYKTIRGRVLLFVAMLSIYACALFIYSLDQKDILLQKINEIDALQETETVLVAADLAVFDAITQLLIVLEPVEKGEVLLGTHEHFNLLTQHYNKLSKLYPERAPSFFALISSLAKVVMSPSLDDLRVVKDNLKQHKLALNELIQANLASRQKLFKEYKKISDQAVNRLILLTLAGIFILVIISNLFFGKVAFDIKRVLEQIKDIVARKQCPPLATKRDDEIGVLIRGINELSTALDERDRQLHIERIDRSYFESVGAIEKLTTGLVHELGNPIAAIDGIAIEIERSREDLSPELQTNITLIKDYCDKLQLINNDLAYLATPTSKEYQLIDFNSIIRKTASLLHYDERWYGVDVELSLDSTLPAFYACDGKLRLLLNSILVNSLEAKIQDKHKVIIETSYIDDKICLMIKDNGIGMNDQVLAQACDAFFTTKDPSEHNGMGLFSCLSIVKAHKGNLYITSTPNQGTEVGITFVVTTSDDQHDEGEQFEP
ncbi:HAMP domain-containing sensor histidine kinase [Thalassotalea sp. G2M2-11]|uniref:sensor histidine kinase n=1 Tax=Thalassotalea sp. G2M2-11 TaxID=2787627 RepID=UPI0019D0CA46|nr:HAMP domain-containing sensor histidine kinase [Thalassotalea sp. G2M2-11]